MQIEMIKPAVAELRDTYSSGLTRPLEWRISQLKALKRMLQEQEKPLLDALMNDLGKSEYEGWSSEIGYTIGEIDFALKNLRKWTKPRGVSTPLVAQPGKSYLLPEPVGTVLIIGAWNYPVQLVLSPLVAAIAAGNCALIKPSELSEKCSAELARLTPQYLDNKAFKVAEGAVEETTEILKQRFDHIIYTGGEMVAKIVMRAAAENLTPVTLELGGKSPCIVDSTTNIDTTAARIVWSKWMNVGQTCVAPDYIIVEKGYADGLVKALKNKLKEFYGDDIRNNKDYGRIVNQRHAKRLSNLLEGQKIVHGGNSDIEARFIEPTIVLNPQDDSALMQDEIFGPILPIVTVDNINDSIDYVKRHPKPLALYVYTKNQTLEDNVLSQLSAGSVCVNDGFMFMTNPNLPFGGVGNSGMGNYHGQYGFDTFSHLKSVMKRGTLLDPALRYPPLTDKKLNLIKKLV